MAMNPRPFPTALLVAGLLALSPLPSSGGYPPMAPILQPYQVVSPEGTWRLDVKPGNRGGAGPADTTLMNVKTGEVAWKRMLPYTFWQCCVNEEGVVGGFAYTEGPLGENDPRKDAGDFVVSFLDARGVPMHEERSHRSPSSIGMGYYIPAHRAYRLLHDPGNHRLVLLMPNGQFRCHSMRDGTLEGAFFPESKGDASAYGWPDEIRFIPDTRLMLLQSNSAWGNDTETTCKSCIQLIDEGGRTIWAAGFHKTYGKDKKWPFPEFRILTTGQQEEADPFANHPLPEEDPFADQLLPEEDPFAEDPTYENDPFAEKPSAEAEPFATDAETPEADAPTAPTEIATFGVHFGDTGEKAKFRIMNTSGNDDPPDYQVEEISREKWELPAESSDGEEDAPPAGFPIAASKKLDGFQLKDADGKPIPNIASIAIGPEETIHALARESSKIHVFDREGKHLRTLDPGKEHTIDTSHYSGSLAADGKGEVFVRISDGYGEEEDKRDPFAGHYLRFSPDGTRKENPLSPPSDEFSGNLMVQPDSGHLIFYGFGTEVAVSRRDEYGSRVATLTHRADGQWLEFIQDVACAPDGTIAVRDTSKGDTFGGFTTPFPRIPNHLPSETITIYKAGGDPIRTLDFSPFAGLSEIAYDGKHIVATFPYDPPTPLVYVFDAEAKPVGAIHIKELAEKESVSLRAFIVSGGDAILAVDLVSGMVFRLAMP
jgi:hypothetical protein